ncbi:MAG TPA: EamA family transporter [Geminicoccaceae bacterium]|nr:EamA family transporter [Geminicoccaceae bacterium]
MSVVAGAPGGARGFVCIVAANLLFALGFSFVAAVDGAMSIWQLVLLRGGVFALALLPWALRHPDDAKGRDRGLLLLRGAVGTAMILCLMLAITALPLSVATLLGKTTPLWELLLLWLLLALRPQPSELLLVPVALLGLVMILHPEGHLGIATLSVAAMLLALAAGLLNSLEFVILSRLRQADAAQAINLWYAAVMIVVGLPLAALQPWPADPRNWLFVGLFCLCSLFGQSLLAAGMRHVPPTVASVGTLLVPAFALLIDWAAFGQLLSLAELAGIALVLAPAAMIARTEATHSAALATASFRWRRARDGAP